MKVLEKKIMWILVMMLMGVALLVVNIIRKGDSATTSFALGLIGVCILKLIQYYRISKNPTLLKKFKIEQKEERMISIAEKSGRYTLLLTILAEFGAIFVLILLNKNEIATILSFVAGLQTLIYLVIYYYLSRKY
ncbi:MAG: hypothetical protein RBR71_07385 [Gudongella sp.]|nr:hypothetical protein [Gudongella sp.]